jgi:hypothetical protein
MKTAKKSANEIPSFTIEIFNKKPKKIAKKMCCWGQITIGDFVEKFIMSLDEWSVDDYNKQWKEGLERIKTHDASCLIADITTLKTNPRVNIWILYKSDKSIFFQNHMLGGEIMKDLSSNLPPYSAKTCYLYIPPREIFSQEGHSISEWEMSVDDFYASLQKKKTPV